MRDKAAEIFVERYRAFSSQQHPRIPRNAEKNSLSARNAENESRGIFSKVKKMKRRRGRGEEKKRGGEKGGERKEGGKSLFLQGLYIISTYTVLF